MNPPTFVTKDLLQKALGKPISSFDLRSAALPGENFTSSIYQITITLEGVLEGTKTLNLFLKVFPECPQRGSFIKSTNLFLRELQIYQSWIPQLMAFQRDVIADHNQLISLSLPTFIAGKATDFSNNNFEENLDPEYSDQANNYLLMVDVKTSLGFVRSDFRLGYTFEECSLVVQELANLHTLSWAFKLKRNLPRLSLLPFLNDENLFWKPGHVKNLNTMLTSSFSNSIRVLEKLLGPDSKILMGAKRLGRESLQIMCGTFNPDGIDEVKMEKFLRGGPPEEPEELKEPPESRVPWLVCIHGDPWSANTLFRRGEGSKHPEKAILCDLQVLREACPTTDLAYLLYISTDTSFRKQYLHKILKVYHDRVVANCSLLGVPAYPGFNLKELERRFQRSKAYGYVQATVSLNILLNGSDLIDNGWGEDEDEEIISLKSRRGFYRRLLKLKKKGRRNVEYIRRIVELSKELWEERVL